MTTSINSSVELLEFYQTVVNQHASIPLNPFKVCIDTKDKDGNIEKKQISFLINHASNLTDKMVNRIGMCQHRCNTCTARFKTMHRLSCKTGQIFFPDSLLELIDTSDPEYNCYAKYNEVCKTACATPITGVTVLRGDMLFNQPMTTGGFNHWYIPINEDDRTDPTIPSETIDLIEALILRYIVQEQMLRVIEPALQQGSASLKLLESILQKVVYGNTFLPATRWLISVVEDLAANGKTSCMRMSTVDRYTLLVPHLINAPYNKDMFSGAVSFFCQTGAQLTELLAYANDEQSMLRICEDRLDPTKYQRPTAEATVGQVSSAMKYLGDFTNSIVSVDELLVEHPETVVVSGTGPATDTSSSMTGFGKQMEAAKSANKSFKTFAERSGESSLTVAIRAVTTVDQLLELARTNNVNIEVCNGSVMYLAKTTLTEDKLSTPFMWAFTQEQSLSPYGVSGTWAHVTHIVPTWKRLVGTKYKNALFVVGGMKAKSTMTNCCFPEFLSSEYSRVCRTAFEGLNKTTPITVPTGPIALGVGVCNKDESNTLSSPLRVRVNSIEITLAKLM
jgi:hypothetical protein